MTERFVSAAEMMCRVLGMPDYRFATIGHPVSSATDDDLKTVSEHLDPSVRQVLSVETAYVASKGTKVEYSRPINRPAPGPGDRLVRDGWRRRVTFRRIAD
jgi:hypothetical protein